MMTMFLTHLRMRVIVSLTGGWRLPRTRLQRLVLERLVVVSVVTRLVQVFSLTRLNIPET